MVSLNRNFPHVAIHCLPGTRPFLILILLGPETTSILVVLFFPNVAYNPLNWGVTRFFFTVLSAAIAVDSPPQTATSTAARATTTDLL